MAVPRTLDDMRADVARWRAEAEALEKEAADKRARADAVEAAIANLEAAAEIASLSSTEHGRDISRRMGATRQENPEGTDRRIAAIIEHHRSRDARPFFRWLGQEPVESWAQRHRHALTGQPLGAQRIYSYLRREKRRVAPQWFREMVAKESAGKVPPESWDAPSPAKKRGKSVRR